jgi:hypothetical protein
MEYKVRAFHSKIFVIEGRLKQEFVTIKENWFNGMDE